MSDASNRLQRAEFPLKAVEAAVVDSLRSLYQEEDVRRCLANRAPEDPAAVPYHAYRLKKWAGGVHWPLVLADEHVPPGGRVLVVGCGTGRMCMWFAEAGYAVTGIDIVPEFIEAARQASATMGAHVRPTYHVVDGYEWPVGDEAFDCVAMMATFLTHCPTASIRGRLFSEARRGLRSGGCLLAEAADRTHPNYRRGREPMKEEALQHLPTSLRVLCGLPGVVVGPFHPFRSDSTCATSTAWYFADPREMWTEIEAAGLRVVRLQTEQNPDDEYACVTVVATKDRRPAGTKQNTI